MRGWPPQYDADYLPHPNQRYWRRNLETMRPQERERQIVRLLRGQLRYAWEHSGFYRRKWRAASAHPDNITRLTDVQKFPFTQKEEYRADQAAHPPYGSNLCIPPSEIASVHGTSGTTGKPGILALSRGDISRISEAHARIMWSFGLRPHDTIMIAAFFSLYMGSWGVLWGTQRLGAKAFPFGAGAPGQTRAALRWVRELRPTALYGTMSYILHVAEVAEEEGVDLARDGAFRIVFTSGEPGGALPSMKQKVRELFSATLIDTGSMGEVTPWMTNAECTAACGMHLWQDVVYTELVDPETHEVVDYGEEGVPVYTPLEREAQPMIRLWSNDLATWTDEPCPCGRTYPRLPKGIYGRFDDMLIIRGENVFPSAIQEALQQVAGFGGEYQVIISRERAMDVLTVRAEYDAQVAAAARNDPAVLTRVRDAMQACIRTQCGVSAIVELLPPQTLPRTQLKAQRVIDRRELYEQLRALRLHPG